MWHFHQLLRTQLQVASTTMKRVRVPFEMIASSVRLLESADEHQQPRMNLSVEVKSDTKFVVQAFWDVKVSALEGACQGATSSPGDWPIKRRLQLVDAVRPTRAALSAIHAVRSLPRRFYCTDFMNTPHRLLDEDIDNGDRALDVPKTEQTGSSLARLFVEGDSFRSCSVMERYNLLFWGVLFDMKFCIAHVFLI